MNRLLIALIASTFSLGVLAQATPATPAAPATPATRGTAAIPATPAMPDASASVTGRADTAAPPKAHKKISKHKRSTPKQAKAHKTAPKRAG